MDVELSIAPGRLEDRLQRMWALSARKLRAGEASLDTAMGSPVFTSAGEWTSRGWTEWTQGFQYGSAILQFDATGEEEFLQTGRQNTVERMAPHLSHVGVHDHGFNNVSTNGNLLRLMNEGRVPEDDPDRRVSLLERLIQHAQATARYSVYYREGRDGYDVPGRVAHESIFNVNDGRYRCPSTQQGYSPFSTWTRGLAWAILGFAEQLEFLESLPDWEPSAVGSRQDVLALLLRALRVTCDFYLENTAADGIPYWDTGAPGLARLGEWRSRPADPFNDHEPVDSSATAIACQGLMRCGRCLSARADSEGDWYLAAGLGVLARLLEGAKGVQLEAALESSRARRWVDDPELSEA